MTSPFNAIPPGDENRMERLERDMDELKQDMAFLRSDVAKLLAAFNQSQGVLRAIKWAAAVGAALATGAAWMWDHMPHTWIR